MIKKGKAIPEKGVTEMRAFANIYNKIYEENSKKNELLSFEVHHDALTKLYNRAAFVKIMTMGGWENVAFLIIDVDNFKKVNDTYGHQTGDKVLSAVGNALQSTFRSGDFSCRLGGDEFAVIMVDVDPRMKELVEFKFKELTKKTIEAEGVPEGTSLSAGVAFGNWSKDSDAVFNNADTALYEAKNGGKSKISFYSED